MKAVIFLFLALSLSLPILAQQPQLLQERSYKESPEEKELLRTAFDKQGNLLFTGNRLVSPQTFSSNLLLVKSNTDTVLTRNRSALLYHSLQALAATPDGGFIFAEATKHPTNTSSSGLFMQKLTSTGAVSWSSNNYFNNTLNVAASVLVMPDNGYLFCGAIQGRSGGLLRTNPAGIVQWQQNPSLSYWDGLGLLQFTKKGRIVGYGATDVPFGPGHPWLVLLNQNGTVLNQKQLVLNGSGRFESLHTHYNSLRALSDGGYLVTGYVDSTNSSNNQPQAMATVVKVDSSFNVQWQYVHRTPTNPVERYIFSKTQELADGSVIVLGFKFRPLPIGNSFQIFRFSPNGQLLNIYPFSSNICSQLMTVTLDALPDSSFLVGGSCGNVNPTRFGYYISKIKVPGLPAVLPPPFVISSTKEEVASGFGLGQSYPNPTAAEAIIPYNLPKNYRKASIIIREITTGREIRKFELKRNESSLQVDLSNLGNGLYLYSLVVDDKPITTKKLAVMK